MIIDFHAHILPGVDHGCADTGTALRQLSLASDAGVGVVCATSHFYPHADTVKSYLERRSNGWAGIQDRLPENSPQVILGAETLVCVGMEHMEGLQRLMFGDGIILLEMPPSSWTSTLIETVEAIFKDICQGRMVLAHVDRYPPDDIERLMDYGIPGQLNAASLLSPLRRRRYMKWIDSGKIAALGSDIHGADKSYATLSKTVAFLGSRAESIMHSSAELLGI